MQITHIHEVPVVELLRLIESEIEDQRHDDIAQQEYDQLHVHGLVDTAVPAQQQLDEEELVLAADVARVAGGHFVAIWSSVSVGAAHSTGTLIQLRTRRVAARSIDRAYGPATRVPRRAGRFTHFQTRHSFPKEKCSS